MPRNALSACDAVGSEHTNVSGGGEQEHDAYEEAHASGCVYIWVAEGVDSEREDSGCSAEAAEEPDPVRPSYVSATPGEPCRGDHVEGYNAADDVRLLGFHDCETEPAGRQRHHRNGEDVSGGAMQRATFTNGHCEGASEQANGAAEYVQNQEREPHASTHFLQLTDSSKRRRKGL